MENFHFIRPEWFYAILPALALYLIVSARHGRGSAWEAAIDQDLLPYLLDKQPTGSASYLKNLLLFGWLLAVTALAGPVWNKTPQPVHEREDALVIVLDLTRSMYATDVKPNRLIRSQRKLSDLLAQRKEGLTGLVVYSGDAHLVSPLADDAKTIAELIPAVSPEIMPAPGSQLAPAIILSQQLFEDAGVSSGRILILTDEIRDVAQAQSVARQHRYAYPVSVLAVGTPEGAPILDPKAGYLRDGSGQMVIPQVNFQSLSEFAAVAGGRFSAMTLEDTDLEFLLAEQPLDEDLAFRETDRDFDIWYEEGPWLILLLLPLAALAFRRGWLWQIALVAIIPINSAEAALWDNLWWTGDQQGQKLYQSDAPAEAAQRFDDPAWKATANYRAENFDAAAELFSTLESATAAYNKGNALAKAGKYPEAIEAYDQALAEQPDHEDAAFNRRLIEELLKSQEQQQQEGEGEDQQPSDSDQNEGQQGDEGDESDQQQNQQGDSQDQQDAQEQESQEQQDAEQQEGDEQNEAMDQQMAESDVEPLSDEEQQALQQWLRKVPDDPGGLLRRKFEMQYLDRLEKGTSTKNDSSDW